MKYQLNLPSIALILEKVRNGAKEAGLSHTAALQVELATEETLVNIWKHGYKEKSGSLNVDIQAEPGERLLITLKDEAPPFDLTQQATFQIRPKEPRPTPVEGGMGLPMIKAFFDVVEYQPLDKLGNELQLIRYVDIV